MNIQPSLLPDYFTAAFIHELEGMDTCGDISLISTSPYGMPMETLCPTMMQASQCFLRALDACVDQGVLEAVTYQDILDLIKTDVFLLKNCPIDPDIRQDYRTIMGDEKTLPTPTDPDEPTPCYKTTFVSEWFQLAISVLRETHPMIIENLYGGHAVHNLSGRSGKLDYHNSKGVAKQGMHVDAAYVSKTESPDVFSLFCLRGRPDAETVLINIQALLDAGYLTDTEIELLSKDNFRLISGTALDQEDLDKADKTAILNFNADNTVDYIRIGRCQCVGKDAEAAEQAYNKLKTLLEDPKVLAQVGFGVILEEGDFLSVNNRTWVHGRSGFLQTAQEVFGRWIQRAYESFANQYEQAFSY